MNYGECGEYLDRLGNEVLTMKFGLDTIRKLLRALGHPEQEFPSMLIAGTNGKGSVARFISSICVESNLRTGLYTSPHLVSITERIRVNGREISQEEFANQFSLVAEVIAKLGMQPHPTFFEMITATALNYFSHQRVDLAVLEVGLGGRLDSTNAVEPVLSVLTQISYDHQQYLGERLSQIGAEKAGILRPGRPALTLPQVPEVRRVLRSQAGKVGSELEEFDLSQVAVDGEEDGRYSFSYEGRRCRLGTWGKHQVWNAALAIRAAEKLAKAGLAINPASFSKGIERTRLPGVLEKVKDAPRVFLDGGHNPEAALSLVRFVEQHTDPPRKLVFGIMKDKMIEQVLTILVKPFQEVYVTQIPSPRAAGPDELRDLYPQARGISNSSEAYRAALKGTETVVVAGSFYLVGEILRGLSRDVRFPAESSLTGS